VIILNRLFDETALRDPLYPFLPLVLCGAFTAFLLAVQWLVELFPVRDQKFQQGQTILKGAFR
jgi:hypothetical protein